MYNALDHKGSSLLTLNRQHTYAYIKAYVNHSSKRVVLILEMTAFLD